MVQPHVQLGPRREGIRQQVHTANNLAPEEHAALVEAHHRRTLVIGAQALGQLVQDLRNTNEKRPVTDGPKVVDRGVEEGLAEGGGGAEPPAADGARNGDHDNMLYHRTISTTQEMVNSQPSNQEEASAHTPQDTVRHCTKKKDTIDYVPAVPAPDREAAQEEQRTKHVVRRDSGPYSLLE